MQGEAGHVSQHRRRLVSAVGAGAMTMSAAITGVGMSDIGRKTGRPAMIHLAEAARRALDCAGLTRDDIDGICTYPGTADNSPGMSPLGKIGRASSRVRGCPYV